MSVSWLQRKRKGDLIDLAQKAGIPDSDGLLKDDLVEQLQARLNSSETTYAKHPDFRDYYGRSGSPVKRERVSPSDALSVTKPRRRTLVKMPSEEPTPRKSSTSTLIARTPRAVSRRVSEVLSEVDIPASPAQLAEVADQSFQVVKGKATELWDRTQIDYIKELIRENASSVAAIQTLILLIEAAGLQWNTLTMSSISTPDKVKSYNNGQNILLPDFLALLTSGWWAPATLWSLTSWVLPFIVSYFFNLTLRSNTQRKSSDRQYPADPFTFNIVKAILAYSAYQRGTAGGIDLSWGPFSSSTVSVVREYVPGGYYGLQIGAVVGILVSLYDAALKK